LKYPLQMAPTAGNSNKPRLGVAMRIRSAATEGRTIKKHDKDQNKVSNKKPTRRIFQFIFIVATATHLLQPYVIFKIILRRIVAFKLPHDSLALRSIGKALFQKPDHQTPGILRRLLAVTSGHGVVQPTVWRVAVQPHVIIFSSLFQASSELKNVIH